MKRIVSTVFVLSASLCLSSLGLWAQTEEGHLSRGFYVKVKPGGAAAFEAGLKAHIQWRKSQGDTWTWAVYQVINGEATGDYMIRSAAHTWEDFDKYQPFLDKMAPHFYASVGDSILGIESSIGTTATEISMIPPSFEGYTLFQLITFHIRPDQQQAFRAAIGQVHATLVKANWPGYYIWVYPINGGSGPEVTLVLPFKSFADMKQPEKTLPQVLTEALGEAEATGLMQKFDNSVRGEDSGMIRFRPDLSLIQQ